MSITKHGFAVNKHIKQNQGNQSQKSDTRIVVVRYTYQSLDTPIYANNSAALTGGLTLGMLYRTGADPDTLCVVH